LLLCIDLQPGFLAAIPGGPAVLARCEFAVRSAVGLGLPVAFTEQAPAKLGGTAPALRAAAADAPVWSKTSFSALGDDNIRRTLVQDQRVGHLLICGLETSICVYQTAIAALAEGMDVTILCDCVVARRADDGRACLEALARHGAHLLPAETVFYALLRDTSHPFFREFTRLVKTQMH
jgi:nicotinamidase-related amidase